jgi:alpha-amylase
MIDVRNAVGIHNESEYLQYASQTGYFAVGTTGTNGELLAVVGSGAASYTPNAKFVKVLSGYRYAYYMSKSMGTAWVDLPSGEYEDAQQAMLTAVSTNGDAQLVYTTDGSDPTATSTKVSSGTKITIDGDVTLKVGLLIGSTVSGIVTRNYTKASVADKRIINIYVNTDNVGWTAVNFWSWGGDDSHSPANNNWPGDKVTATTSISGKNWYSKQYTINGEGDFVNFVFSTGSGSPQTVDINNVSTDKFFEISTAKDGTKYLVTDVSDQYTAICPVFASENVSSAIYTLDGRRVTTPKRGIFIRGGKKFVVK